MSTRNFRPIPAVTPPITSDEKDGGTCRTTQDTYRAILKFLRASGLPDERARQESEIALTDAICQLVGSGQRPVPAALLKCAMSIVSEKLMPKRMSIG